MPYEQTIGAVRRVLQETFAEVDRWFDRPAGLRCFRPVASGWTIDQVLEHVSMTNHFLLLTVSKHADIACRRAARGDPIPDGESDLARLDVIGQRGSFGWERPEHMEPAGLPPAEVRMTIRRQLAECIGLLDRLARGEGTLCRVRMTVNDLGKIDLYQWLYFLAQHARRHLQQMAAIEREFLAATAPTA